MTEYKISQEAMKKLKDDYVLLEVENITLGLCKKNIAGNLRKADCKNENFVEQYASLVGYVHKNSCEQFNKDFGMLYYDAKSNNKVYNGAIENMRDSRGILVSAEEKGVCKDFMIDDFGSVTSHQIQGSSGVPIIPKKKIKCPVCNESFRPYNKKLETVMADFLKSQGVGVKNIPENQE